jgi:mycothiol synthase
MRDLRLHTHGSGGWTVDLPTDATTEDDLTAALSQAIAAVAHKGGGPLRVWVHGDGPGPLRLHGGPAALSLGFRLERTLHQLRRPLPVDELMVPTVPTRPFVPGEDDEAWLAVNNRAFATPPEQGAWTPEELAQRLEEPWFDPSGFLLHEEGGRLLGFCWTKVHREADPPLGEIYVIAVDPSVHQQGLGKRLVVTGLDHLASLGLRTGMLYVDAANGPATRLYARLAFQLHHLDHAYLLQVEEGGDR